jgi:sigma-E factor negative regulatory protein RseB
MLVLAAADTEQSARDWLEKMANAVQSLNYDGTFVYRTGDRIESMRIIHRAGPDDERERMVSLTGAPREVLRDSEKVVCILPDSQSVVVAKSRPRRVALRTFDPEEGFAAYYRLSSRSGERVAGRETMMVTVDAVDEFRYGFRLWLDRVTGLLLKSELIGEANQALEQIMYTGIKLPAQIPDELLEPAISGEGFTWYRDDPAITTSEPESNDEWSVGWLPAGFEMSDRVYNPPGVSRMPVEHLVYSDGLASLSVFIERLDTAAERLEGRSSMGAMNAYGSVIDSFQVTVVGEVPGVTVERVGKSVNRR